MSSTGGRRERQFIGGTGFYIALFLCVTALAVAGYWTLLPHSTSNQTVVPDAAQTPVNVPVTPAQTPVSRPSGTPVIPVLSDDEPDAKETLEPTGDDPAQPAQAPVELTVPDSGSEVIVTAPRLIVSPLSGETVAAFSGEMLAYNETLGDWRVHDGVDIAATLGTHVLAACSGTVKAVYDDDMMGATVVLSHGDGYETVYANLQSVPTVGEGQYVSAGQVVGSVGATALAEAKSAPHLHFSVTKDGEPVDPEQFLSQ